MFNSDDDRSLQSDLEKLRTERMRTEVYETREIELSGYGLIVTSSVLVVACGVAFNFGFLGYEAGLSLFVLIAALIRKQKLKRSREEKRNSQVRLHRMMTGNSESWGRGDKN